MKKKTGILIALLAAVVVLGVALVPAQEQQQPPQQPDQQQTPRPGHPPHPPMDPLGGNMFPPEMIMQHQRELALTDEQKAFMRGEINRTTTRFNELQWQLQDAMEALHETMKANAVDEQQALSQLNRVLDSEREIKTLHLQLAIRIKNKLTAEQQEKLRAMHDKMGHGPGGPGRGPGQGPGRGPGGPPPTGRPDGPRPDGPDNPPIL